MQIYKVRKQPEPFYCHFKNADTYYPFNTLDAKPCEVQCIKCECYQEGSNEFNPRHLPAIQYDVELFKSHAWVFKLWDEEWFYVCTLRLKFENDRF